MRLATTWASPTDLRNRITGAASSLTGDGALCEGVVEPARGGVEGPTACGLLGATELEKEFLTGELTAIERSPKDPNRVADGIRANRVPLLLSTNDGSKWEGVLFSDAEENTLVGVGVGDLHRCGAVGVVDRRTGGGAGEVEATRAAVDALAGLRARAGAAALSIGLGRFSVALLPNAALDDDREPGHGDGAALVCEEARRCCATPEVDMLRGRLLLMYSRTGERVRSSTSGVTEPLASRTFGFQPIFLRPS